MTTTLAILAAGLGTRFGGGGTKQLEPLGPSGETLIDYSIHDALLTGFENVVLIVRPEQDRQFRDTVIARWSHRTRIGLVHQTAGHAREKKAWGTAHATMSIRNSVDGPFAVINGDDFYGREAIALVASFCSAVDQPPPAAAFAADYAVVGFPLVNTLRTANSVSRALLHSDADGWLTNIEEARITPGPAGAVAQPIGNTNTRIVTADSLVSMNMWGFTPAIFPQLEEAYSEFVRQHGESPEAEFRLPQFVQQVLAEGAARVSVLRGKGSPTGITHPDDRHSVRDFLRDGVERGDYSSPIWR